MDFKAAIQAHTSWKLKLRTAINNDAANINIDDLAKDNLCPLGQWIYTLDGSKKSDPAFLLLKENHAKFHAMSAEIARNVKRGNLTAVEEMLSSDSEYSKLPNGVVSALMKLDSASS